MILRRFISPLEQSIKQRRLLTRKEDCLLVKSLAGFMAMFLERIENVDCSVQCTSLLSACIFAQQGDVVSW